VTLLQRIGGRNAISGWSYWLTLVVFLIATMLPSSRDQFTGSAMQRLTLALAGTLAAFVLLLVASASVLPSAPRAARPATALAVFGLAGVVQACSILGVRWALHLPVMDPVLLVVTRALAGILWLSVIAVLVDEVRTHQERMVVLMGRVDAVAAALEHERTSLGTTLAGLRDETIAPLNAALSGVAQRLAAMSDATAAQEQAAAVRRLVDEDVRPLSHELLQRDVFAVDPEGPPPALERRERIAAIIRLAASSLAAPTWLAVLLPMVMVLLFAVQHVGPLFILCASASYVVVMWVAFTVLRGPLDRVLPRLRPWVAAVAVLATYEALAIVAVVNSWAWGGLSAIGRWVEWPTLVTLPVVWVGIAIARAAQDERRRDEGEMERVLADYRLVTARGRQRLRHEYQSLGRLLHGSVQASLLAISRRLDAAAAAPPDARRAALNEAAADLKDLGRRISAPDAAHWRAAGALDDVVALWRGLIEVRLSYGDGVLDQLDSVPATRTTVVDVVAEGITNAARHGLAAAVDVTIAVDAPDRISITIADDGRGDAGGTPGMGTGLLDAVAAEWGRVGGDPGCTVSVAVPIDRSQRPSGGREVGIAGVL